VSLLKAQPALDSSPVEEYLAKLFNLLVLKKVGKLFSALLTGHRPSQNIIPATSSSAFCENKYWARKSTMVMDKV
jgi:hypothetical protein